MPSSPKLVLVILAVFEFYFISISIDRKLTLDAQRRLEANVVIAGVGTIDSSAEYFSYEK